MLILSLVLASGAEAADTEAKEPEAATTQAPAAEGAKKSKTGTYQLDEVTVTGKIVDEATEKLPAVVESLTAEGMERINVVDITDESYHVSHPYPRRTYFAEVKFNH